MMIMNEYIHFYFSCIYTPSQVSTNEFVPLPDKREYGDGRASLGKGISSARRWRS